MGSSNNGVKKMVEKLFQNIMKKRTYSMKLAKLYLKRLDTLHEEIHIVRGETILVTVH